MDITSGMLYLITRANAIKDLLTLAITIFIVMFIVSCIIYICTVAKLDNDEEENENKLICKCKSWIKYSIISATLLLLSNVFLPSTNQFAAIYVIPKVANNQEFKNIGKNTVDILHQLTANYLKSITNTTTGDDNKK